MRCNTRPDGPLIWNQFYTFQIAITGNAQQPSSKYLQNIWRKPYLHHSSLTIAGFCKTLVENMQSAPTRSYIYFLSDPYISYPSIKHVKHVLAPPNEFDMPKMTWQIYNWENFLHSWAQEFFSGEYFITFPSLHACKRCGGQHFS